MIQKILAFSFLVVATASVANPPIGMPSSQSEKPNSASSSNGSNNNNGFYGQFYGNQPTPGTK